MVVCLVLRFRECQIDGLFALGGGDERGLVLAEKRGLFATAESLILPVQILSGLAGIGGLRKLLGGDAKLVKLLDRLLRYGLLRLLESAYLAGELGNRVVRLVDLELQTIGAGLFGGGQVLSGLELESNGLNILEA